MKLREKKDMDSNFDEFIRRNLTGRILGLDVGDKTVGVSVSDLSQMFASGVSVINRTSLNKDLLKMNEILQNFKPCAIVYGWPVQTDGQEGPQCKKVRSFVESVGESFDGIFMAWDERFSSKVTDSVLIKADLSRSKRAKVIDKVAAIYILQGALDLINNKKRMLQEDA